MYQRVSSDFSSIITNVALKHRPGIIKLQVTDSCLQSALRPGFIFGRLGGNVGEWNFRKIEFCKNYWVLSWNFLEFSKEISWVFEKSWVSVEFAFTDIERLRCKGSTLNIMLKIVSMTSLSLYWLYWKKAHHEKTLRNVEF